MKHLVIASMPRSGSTVLSEMVAHHPAVLGFTEIFNDNRELRKGCHHRGVGDSGLFAYEHGAYARPDLYLDFLEAVAGLKGKPVLSYKLMESQCPALYTELPRRQSFLVHLRRENLIALAASWKIAVASERWHATKEEHRAELAKHTCRVESSDIEEWHRREGAQLALLKTTRLPMLSLTYREIAESPTKAARRLFDLIEVAPISVAATQLKANNRPLSSMVENLADLRSVLTGSPFEWMANDDRGAW